MQMKRRYDVVIDRKAGTTRRILDDIHGHIEAGSLVALMGPSGAGKTTLLNTLAQRDSGGSVRSLARSFARSFVCSFLGRWVGRSVGRVVSGVLRVFAPSLASAKQPTSCALGVPKHKQVSPGTSIRYNGREVHAGITSRCGFVFQVCV